MMSRSSAGRFSRTSFSKSRNLVAVRTLVAICWRSVAITDYSWGKRALSHQDSRVSQGTQAESTSSKPVPIASPSRAGDFRSILAGAAETTLRPEHSFECIDAFTHAHHVLRQRQRAAGLDQRDHAIEVRPGMGTSDQDPNRVKQLFAFGSGLVLHLANDGFEILRAETILTAMHASAEGRYDLATDLRLK